MAVGEPGNQPLGIRRHAQVATEQDIESVTIYPLPTGEGTALAVAQNRSTVTSVTSTMESANTAAEIILVAILVIATLVTRFRSQTGKSVSVSTQCAFFLSRFLIICPYKMVFKFSWSLFRYVLAFLFFSHHLSNASGLLARKLRETTRCDLAILIIGVGKLSDT